jgi:hypothetical protein
MFLIVLCVAPSKNGEGVLCNQMTAEVAEALVFVIVRFLEAVDKGQTVFAVEEIEPSIVTQSAPFKTIKAVALEPVILIAGKVVLIVKVFVALANGFAFIVIGNVSLTV